MTSGEEYKIDGESGSTEEETLKKDQNGIGDTADAGGLDAPDPAAGSGEGDEESKHRRERDAKEHKHGRARKSSTDNMADLLHKKNLMLQDLKKRLSDSEESLKHKEDKILRMAAEFENYKKRTRREWELLQLKANAELLGRIINVLDDFDRALAAMEGEGDHFVDGIRMIHAGLIDILKRSGLSEIEAEGRLFDPNFHEAIGEAESDKVEPGCVLQVVQKGYMLHDQLLRPARVIVARSGAGEAG